MKECGIETGCFRIEWLCHSSLIFKCLGAFVFLKVQYELLKGKALHNFLFKKQTDLLQNQVECKSSQ